MLLQSWNSTELEVIKLANVANLPVSSVLYLETSQPQLHQRAIVTSFAGVVASQTVSTASDQTPIDTLSSPISKLPRVYIIAHKLHITAATTCVSLVV